MQTRRHLLQELCVSPFVPNDTCIDLEHGRMKILTGPNASGKSVYLKQVKSFVRSHELSLQDIISVHQLKNLVALFGLPNSYIVVFITTPTGWSDCVPGPHWQLCSSRGGKGRACGPDLHQDTDTGVRLCCPLHLPHRPQPGTMYWFVSEPYTTFSRQFVVLSMPLLGSDTLVAMYSCSPDLTRCQLPCVRVQKGLSSSWMSLERALPQ